MLVTANQTQATQPTATIKVRPYRKQNKSAHARRLMLEQPHLKPCEIAKIVGCKPHTVHNVKYMLKKKGTGGQGVRVSREMPFGVDEVKGFTADQAKSLIEMAAQGRGRNRADQPAKEAQYDQAKTIITQNLHVTLMRMAINDVILMLVESGRTDLLATTQFKNLVKSMHNAEVQQL